VKWKLTQKQ